MDAGILSVVTYLMFETKNQNLRDYIEEHFYKKVDVNEFEYHFKKNNLHFATVTDVIKDNLTRQKVDDALS